MAYKLLDMAHARWRGLDGAYLLPFVRRVFFVNSLQQKRKASEAKNDLKIAWGVGPRIYASRGSV